MHGKSMTKWLLSPFRCKTWTLIIGIHSLTIRFTIIHPPLCTKEPIAITNLWLRQLNAFNTLGTTILQPSTQSPQWQVETQSWWEVQDYFQGLSFREIGPGPRLGNDLVEKKCNTQETKLYRNKWDQEECQGALSLQPISIPQPKAHAIGGIQSMAHRLWVRHLIDLSNGHTKTLQKIDIEITEVIIYSLRVLKACPGLEEGKQQWPPSPSMNVRLLTSSVLK